jgi:hypothetical protein
MPSWKKVIVSGSDASLNSLNVINGITGSLLGTSSYASNADLLDGLNSTAFVLNTQTSSFVQNSQTSSFVQNSQTGAFATFTALNAYTSSINTYTSSLNTKTSSFVLNSQTSSFVQNSQTSSFATFTALNAYTSSINTYTSSINAKTSSFATTGSNNFNGNQNITGSLTISSSLAIDLNVIGGQNITGSLNVSGSTTFIGNQVITGSVILSSSAATELNVIGGQNITGSLNVSGSTTFTGGSGTTLLSTNADTLIFTGSLFTSGSSSLSGSISISGSLSVNGSNVVLTNQTSSFLVSSQTSSFATFTALNAYTSSINSYTSSLNSATSSFVRNSQTSSFVLNSQTSSMSVLSASFAVSSSQASNAANANTIDVSVFGADFDSYLLMSNAVATSGVGVGGDADLRYNTSTNKLTVGNISATTLTGSLLGTASYASNSNLLDGLDSSAFVQNNLTSSFVLNSQTSSMTVLSASYASGSSNILGGSANRILYQSAANVTATDANFIWTGTVLNLGSATGSVQVPYTGKFASSLDNTNHYLPHDGSGTSILRTNNVDKIKIGYGTAGNIDISGSTNITGSLIVTGSLISLNGSNVILTNQTSSFTLNSQTSSFVQNSQTSSFATFTALNAYTSSINTYTSSLNAKTSSFATTGSNSFNGNQNITGSLLLSGSLTSTGTITAQTLVVQTVSSSVIYSSGSNTFGNSLANTQVLTGSVIVTGSLSVNGSNTVLTNQTSSFVLNSQTSSFVQNSQTGAFATFTALNAYTSSINNFSASILSYTASQNNLNGTYATTSSFNAYTSSINTYTSSLNSKTSSFATTGSNTFNGNQIITGSLAVGTSSLGPNENNITLGARDNVNEGGQIGFNAPGGTFASASFIDNWSNFHRILRGTNASSTGLVAQWNLGTLQMELPGYTSVSSFAGTAAANLAVDSSGKVITVSTTGGSVFPYVGNAVITGSLTVTQPIYVPINGAMYFQGGDDAALYDVNIINTMGIYGVQDVTVGAVKLGSNGPVLYGSGSRLGLGTTTPLYALDINANTLTGARVYSGSLAVGNITPSATVGRIDASNDVVAFSTSDIRFKENINPIDNALEKLDQIGGYTFDWKTEEELVSLHGFKGHDVGVIAQEIESILPEIVTTRDSGYKAVKYEKIVPLLIQAIKEQQEQIKELQDIIKNK